MRNVTITLDEETHRAARIAAAERGMSLSGLVRDLLGQIQPGVDVRADAVRKSFEAMDRVKRFSAGNRLPREALHDR